jgi:hypothetical protein
MCLDQHHAAPGPARASALMIRSDLPVTFLFPELKVSVAHRRIRGLESPSRANPLFYMEDLWIDEN